MFRPFLMESLSYAAFSPSAFGELIPKVGTQRLCDAMTRISNQAKSGLDNALVSDRTEYVLHFKKTAYNWLNFCKSLPPCFDSDGRPISHTEFGEVWLADSESRDVAFTFLNGKIMFAYWCIMGDDFDVTRWMFASFPLDLKILSDAQKSTLVDVANSLEECMRQTPLSS